MTTLADTVSQIWQSDRPPGDRLREIYDLCWTAEMADTPELATMNGIPGRDHLWKDNSMAAYQGRRLESDALFEVIRSIPAADLSTEDRLTFELFYRRCALAVEGHRYPLELLGVSVLGGIHIAAPRTLQRMGGSVDLLEAALERLRQLPNALADQVALLDEGIRTGIVQPRSIVRGVPDQVRRLLQTPIAENPFVSPFADAATSIRADAAVIFRQDVLPAFTAFVDFLERSYIPAARMTSGWSELPNGSEWYGHLIRAHTGTTLSAAELHQAGLEECDRVELEIADHAMAAGASSVSAYELGIRSDPTNYFATALDAVDTYRSILDETELLLPTLFKCVPSTHCVVRLAPSFDDHAPCAWYVPAAAGQARGTVWVNFLKGATPRWEARTLALHEGVPGHHLQFSIAAQMTDAPAFRRAGFGSTAFVEGWATYCESLSNKLGLPRDSLSRYGELCFDAWRSARLVVDTGLHAFGWTTERAIQCLCRRGRRPRADAVREVDRYLSSPAQGLAYKVGQLAIASHAAAARARFGTDLDEREFHKLLLEEGALPLDMLSSRVSAWLAH